MLWHCCLGLRKTNRPVELTDEVLLWLSVRSEVQIVCIWSSWCHCRPKTPSSLDSFKSRLVLPFWYRLTRVVLEKRQLNGWSVVVVVKGMKNGNRSTINWIRVSRSVPVTKRADYYWNVSSLHAVLSDPCSRSPTQTTAVNHIYIYRPTHKFI